MNNELRIEKANAVLKRIVEDLKSDCFKSMNLKLHDISYYCYKNMENDFPLCSENNDNFDFFDAFCAFQYDDFMEWCKEHYIDFDKMRYYIGRTSSFYLHKWYDNNIDYMLYDILNDIDYTLADYFTLDNGVIVDTDIADYPNETIEVLEYVINDFENDYNKLVEDIKLVYNYIADFKDNQVEIFKEFLEYYEDDFKEQNEIEAKKIDNDLNKAIEIVNKYKVSSDDVETLKNVIYTL